MGNKWVVIDKELGTTKSGLVRWFVIDDNDYLIPNSQIKAEDIDFSTGDVNAICLPEWLIKEKGLEAYTRED